jgi:predicted Fe-S protein YdhL (DUF1289 family)
MVPPILPETAMLSTDSSIETPCVRDCLLHPGHGLCMGCGRSVDEIAHWIGFSGEERRRIMAALPPRLKALGIAALTTAAA